MCRLGSIRPHVSLLRPTTAPQQASVDDGGTGARLLRSLAMLLSHSIAVPRLHVAAIMIT